MMCLCSCLQLVLLVFFSFASAGQVVHACTLSWYVHAEMSTLRCCESESQRKTKDERREPYPRALCVQIEGNESSVRGRLSTSMRIKYRSLPSTVFYSTPAFNLQVRVLVHAGFCIIVFEGSGGVGTEEGSGMPGMHMHSTSTQCDLMCLLTKEPANTNMQLQW